MVIRDQGVAIRDQGVAIRDQGVVIMDQGVVIRVWQSGIRDRGLAIRDQCLVIRDHGLAASPASLPPWWPTHALPTFHTLDGRQQLQVLHHTQVLHQHILLRAESEAGPRHVGVVAHAGPGGEGGGDKDQGQDCGTG